MKCTGCPGELFTLFVCAIIFFRMGTDNFNHIYLRTAIYLSIYLFHQTTIYDFQMTKGYKGTTYNISAHKGLQKNLPSDWQEKDTLKMWNSASGWREVHHVTRQQLG